LTQELGIFLNFSAPLYCFFHFYEAVFNIVCVMRRVRLHMHMPTHVSMMNFVLYKCDVIYSKSDVTAYEK